MKWFKRVLKIKFIALTTNIYLINLKKKKNLIMSVRVNIPAKEFSTIISFVSHRFFNTEISILY